MGESSSVANSTSNSSNVDSNVTPTVQSTGTVNNTSSSASHNESSNTGTSLRFPSIDSISSMWNIGKSDAILMESELDFDIPFAPFLRSEKLGRIADWSSPMGDGTSYRRHHVRPTGPKLDEEDSGWTVTTADAKGNNTLATGSANNNYNNRPASQNMTSGLNGRISNFTGRGNNNNRNAKLPHQQHFRKNPSGWGPRFNDRNAQRKREFSVLVGSNWKLLEEIEFSRLSKLQLDPDESIPLNIEDGNETKFNDYDALFDRISTKNEKILPPLASETSSLLPLSLPLREDQTAFSFAKEQGASVIVNDYVASILMASCRTAIPWDVNVSFVDGILLIEERQNSNVALVQVNENAADSPSDTTDLSSSSSSHSTSNDLNGANFLAKEATRIKSQLIPMLSKNWNNFSYRYSKCDLGDGVIAVVRSVHSINNTQISVLLEYEHKGTSGMDWKLKLDSQRGAVYAHEIRNNGALLARTVFEALLNGHEHIKLAFLSRQSARDAKSHTLLGVHDFETYELASQMNLNVPNGFGILRALIDLFRRLPPGCDYSILRDPQKPLLRLYRLPGGENADLENTIDELIAATEELTFDAVSPATIDSITDLPEY